jgi:HEPN domain-containing protein
MLYGELAVLSKELKVHGKEPKTHGIKALLRELMIKQEQQCPGYQRIKQHK